MRACVCYNICLLAPSAKFFEEERSLACRVFLRFLLACGRDILVEEVEEDKLIFSTRHSNGH